MKAMIFAAGLGKRLGKISETIPKPLVDINGKTVLQRAVEKCTAAGFDDLIINVHHFADKVEAEVRRLNRLGFRISVSDERAGLLENGGGLYQARGFFGRDPFLLYNVDILSDCDLSGLYEAHRLRKGLATLAVRHRPEKRVLLVDRQSRLRGWRNLSTGEQILAGPAADGLSEIAFSSMHIVESEIFDYMRAGVYSMVDLYLGLAPNHPIYTWPHEGGYWVDMGTPESLDYARTLLLEG